MKNAFASTSIDYFLHSKLDNSFKRFLDFFSSKANNEKYCNCILEYSQLFSFVEYYEEFLEKFYSDSVIFHEALRIKKNFFEKKSQSCYYDTFHIGVVIMSDE